MKGMMKGGTNKRRHLKPMKGNFGMKSAIQTIQSISHKLKRSKGFTKVNGNKDTENDRDNRGKQKTLLRTRGTKHTESLSTFILGKPGWRSLTSVFTFCIHKSGQQPNCKRNSHYVLHGEFDKQDWNVKKTFLQHLKRWWDSEKELL